MRTRHSTDLRAAAAAIMSILALSAGADVIYDNGAPDVVSIFYSDPASGVQVAEDFSVGAGANTLADIHWWGAHNGNPGAGSSLFDLVIYDGDGGVPGSVVWQDSAVVNRQITGQTLTNVPLDLYAYDYILDTPLALVAGQTYYLSISTDTSNTQDGTWGWATHTYLGGLHYDRLLDGSQDWAPWPSQLAFYLTGPGEGAVPEPATLSLMGIGLVGLVVRRVRRQG